MKTYLVLIGDLVGSRELEPEQRGTVQQTLKSALSDLNRQAEELVSPHTVTLGDEFQAVYETAGPLLSDSWAIMSALHPVQIRFSFGVGGISTDLNREQAIGMDGPAFHAARRGMERLKKTGFFYQFTSPFTPAGQNGNTPDPAESLINETLHLVSREMESWKKTRFSVLHLLDKNASIREIASRLEISETAVYKNRQSGSLDILLAMGRSIPRLINERYDL